ncbi:unnamed protein product, partial [Symbiodinium pilosum]
MGQKQAGASTLEAQQAVADAEADDPVTEKTRVDARSKANGLVLGKKQENADGNTGRYTMEKKQDDDWLASSEVYPNCSLRTKGSFVGELMRVNDFCVWRDWRASSANWVQVTVKQSMNFHCSLTLQGELQIIGAVPLDGPLRDSSVEPLHLR